MAVKLNEKNKKYFVYGKIKNLKGEYINYKKQTNFTSKKKAQEFDKEYKKELEKNQVIDDSLMFSDLIDEYLKTKNFALGTVKKYEALKDMINLKVDDLSITTIKRATNKLSYLAKSQVKAVLGFAYKHRYINDKLDTFIINVKKEAKGIELFDKNLITTERDFKFSNGVYLNDIMIFLLESGLRINELTSVTWDRIYDDHIKIDRQMETINGEWVFTKLKSKNSERDIPITDNMKKIIEKQPFYENGFLFGGVRKMSRQQLRFRINENYNTHPHALRHTHASYLIEYSYEVLGYCDKDNIAKHMGHTVSMLESTYKHLFRDKKDEIKQVLNYAFKKH